MAPPGLQTSKAAMALHLAGLDPEESESEIPTPRGPPHFELCFGQLGGKPGQFGGLSDRSSGASTPVHPAPPPPPRGWPVPIATEPLPAPKFAAQAMPLEAAAANMEVAVVSVGAVGHPHACAEACPYVKRKGGCKDGASCRRCHLCFWQRPVVRTADVQKNSTGAEIAVMATVPPPPPPPPEAALRQRWPRPQQFVRGTVVHQSVVKVAAMQPAELGALLDGPASVGSIGHPHACEQACKYNTKGKGCKDGRWCVRCHICQWRRYHG